MAHSSRWDSEDTRVREWWSAAVIMRDGTARSPGGQMPRHVRFSDAPSEKRKDQPVS